MGTDKPEHESPEDQAYRVVATVYPHECYDEDPERFWKWFMKKKPLVTRDEMIQILNFTREGVSNMTDHKTRLRELASRGYILSHGGHVHWPERLDKARTSGAVYLERDGQQPEAIYLDLTDGMVMPLGWNQDYGFSEFLKLLDGGGEVGVTNPVRVQLGLF